jgi:hypothetical protein
MGAAVLVAAAVLSACSGGKRPTVEPIPSTTSSSVASTSTTAVVSATTTTAANTVPIEVTNAYDAVSRKLWDTIRASMALITGKHTQQPASSRAVAAINTYLIGAAAIPFPSFLSSSVAGATTPWTGIGQLFSQLSGTAPGSGAAESLIAQLNAEVPPAIAAINTLRNQVHLPPLA